MSSYNNIFVKLREKMPNCHIKLQIYKKYNIIS